MRWESRRISASHRTLPTYPNRDEFNMYLTHWQLAARPFENAADVRFFYPGESQQAALLKLRYAVENRQAAAVLAGTAGLGKTLLVQALLKQLGENYAPAPDCVPANAARSVAGGDWRPAHRRASERLAHDS